MYLIQLFVKKKASELNYKGNLLSRLEMSLAQGLQSIIQDFLKKLSTMDIFFL